MRNYFYAAAAIVLAASCVKENPMQDNGQIEVNYVPMEFTSVVETKTELTAEGKVNWLAGDQISIFDNSATAVSHNNKFTVLAGGSSTASFTGTVPDDATGFYALYPYSEGASNASDTVRFTLPAIQAAKAGSFADDLAIMVAKADAENKIAFRNICSHIKFTLAEDLTDVKSITLMGNKAEILAGGCAIKWNDGDLQMFVPDMKNSETYVTLRNEDGSALVPGDYYFTVLPVTFAEGFTVILSKTDGSQVAKKTTAANDKIASRNKVLVMKPLASTEYAEHLNYFVKYNDGFDLTFGGVTINKDTYPGGILTSDNKRLSWNTAATPNGVFFIDPNCTKALSNRSEQFNSLIIIGADSSVKSPYVFSKAIRFAEGGSLMLMANLDGVANSGSASLTPFAQHSSAQFASFGNIVLSNCHFRRIAKNFFEFNVNDISELNICVEDCDFGIEGATVYILNTGSKASTIQNVTFNNNIFYAESASAATKFKLVHSDALVIAQFNAESNTFDNTIPDTNLLRIGDISTSFDMKKNLFYEVNKTASTNKLIAFPINTKAAAEAKGLVTNNVYYNSTADALTGAGIGTSSYDKERWTINTVKQLTSNPMPETWNPAEEVYGDYNFESGVSNTIGAKRANKAAIPGAASYRFPSVDLGAF
ncbi:MAG: hypothetical protein ACI3ZL_09245 [Candidatus Cryptobacteroides sp.]